MAVVIAVVVTAVVVAASLGLSQKPPKRFGLKEAEVVKNEVGGDRKHARVVLATLNVLGVPNVVAKDVDALRARLAKKNDEAGRELEAADAEIRALKDEIENILSANATRRDQIGRNNDRVNAAKQVADLFA